uniref:Glycosyltransferase n=1 Tax=Linum usitatissimum TaxID=4006 RepID=I2BHE6_LINUS|nr:UDP-glycosyltransferase 1 [Linum usitatissimum]
MDYDGGGGQQQMKRTTVLLLPSLGPGHISPYLELSKRLSSHNFNVYLCSTPANLNPLKPKLLAESSTITLVELHLPSTPQLPPHYHTTNGLPPHLMPHLKLAFDSAATRSAFSSILMSVSPDLLIYDFLQPWAPQLASSLLHIPAVLFLSTGAAMFAFAAHAYKFGRDNINNEASFPFASSIYLRDDREERAFVSRMLEPTCGNEINDHNWVQLCQERSCSIILIKTFREIEGKYLDYISELAGKRHVPVGPLLQKTTSSEEDGGRRISKWLDAKQTSSTVFVSFGSEFFLSPDLIHEIAHGLELSGANFVWVLRFPLEDQKSPNSAAAEALPPGFLDRVGEKGLVVEGWAPQSAILAHDSVGGFVSHCGWSSVMESMWYGVPIVAMPMHLDQPLNARLVEEIGVGVEVTRDGRSGKADRKEVAKVIREVVMGVEGNNGVGEKVRRKAREMSEVMKKKGDLEIDDVVHELLQLCRSTSVNYN